MTKEATARDAATQPGAVALTEGLGQVPDATWAAVERYADEVHDFNVAVKIDVGVDKASAKCLKAESDARSAVLAFADAAVAEERERWAKKPLTFAQLDAAARDAQIKFCLKSGGSFEEEFARAIELAHGIGD